MNTYIPTVDVAVDCVDDISVRLDELLLSSRKKENKKRNIIYFHVNIL